MRSLISKPVTIGLTLCVITEWKCPTCNDGISDVDRQAIKFMFGMCTVTILSFTWFVGGFGALI